MLRTAFIGIRRSVANCQQLLKTVHSTNNYFAVATPIRSFYALQPLKSLDFQLKSLTPTNALTLTPLLAAAAAPTRSLTKFSLKKGKRKTVKPVLKRFMRLDWGGWIRTRQGRNKKMWKKTGALKRRLRQHVMVNATQAWMLDKMVTKFWRRPKYYVNDPYRPYHSREEFTATRRTPLKY